MHKGPPRKAPRRWLAALCVLALLGSGALAAGLFYLQEAGITPRALAPYVVKRSSGHSAPLPATGEALGSLLLALDRGAQAAPGALGFSLAVAPAPPAGRQKLALDAQQVLALIGAAQPGDVITLTPGRYRFDANVNVRQAGTAAAPIVVRAPAPGTVSIEFNAPEGFKVSAPHWRFENLTLRGICGKHDHCEHAFHVVGEAHHFAALNNSISDFNAHFKINGSGASFPDHGLIDGNTLTNSAARRTGRPVTPIDLVAASHWTIRRNLISDFIKAEGDRVSYGGFAKGAGGHNVFEQNVVLCEHRLRGLPGQRVGLSLGGGGTGKAYCRDTQCITEQEQGVIRANLIAACSDVGIYVNNAAASKLTHNSVIDSAGVEVRFAGSSAEVEGNLVDGGIRSRNGAQLRAADNLVSPVVYAYLGYHPQRSLYRAPEALDFRWADGPVRRSGVAAPGPDLCGAPRPPQPSYGAVEDIGACRALSATTSSSSAAN